MASKISLVNIALTRLGVEAITSFEEDSKAAKSANIYYDQIIEDVLSQHHWNFATSRVELALNSISPAFEYTNAYTLPDDCLRVISLYEDEEYIIEGNSLLTNSKTAKIIYIKKITNPLYFSASFKNVVTWRLGAELAIPLTDSNTLNVNHFNLYEQALKEAKLYDLAESNNDS